MLKLILIDVQYLQKAVFSFEKGSNHQNHSSSGSNHPVKDPRPPAPPPPPPPPPQRIGMHLVYLALADKERLISTFCFFFSYF